MALIEIGNGKFNYTGTKNETSAKNLAREDLTKLFLEFLTQRFGEEHVGLVDKNTVGFVFGDVNDKDGYLCDMAATLKVVIKNYQDHCGTKKYTPAWDFYEAKKVFEETGKPMGEL